MPDPRNLTEPLIRNLKPATAGQRYAVADAVVPGLKIRVTDKGAKSFVLWRRYPGAKNSAAARSLGKVGELTLADARTKARAWLALLAQGKDPSVEDARKRHHVRRGDGGLYRPSREGPADGAWR